MPRAELLQEAARQITICNACRYCEGYCAVFPAMELRQVFNQADMTYLANLCHDCRDCYYACQFAPPHEYAVNIPQVFAEIRRETYRDYSWPATFGGLFRRNGRAVALITVVSTLLIVVLTYLLTGPGTLFSPQTGEGAFYRVISYEAMVWPAGVLAVWGAAVFAAGFIRFWRDMGPLPGGPGGSGLRALLSATRDVFTLRYLGGGEAGCNYPGADFSTVRRRFHHLVFYGFLLCTASTTVAAIYEHLLGWRAPYPLLSLPVVLGTVGGVLLLLGTAGLLYLKARADREPAVAAMRTMDVAFLVLLLVTSLTGLILLALRETPAMGTLLAIHLGAVAGVFITAPYGKFAHMVYRYAALLRYALEQARAPAGHG